MEGFGGVFEAVRWFIAEILALEFGPVWTDQVLFQDG